MGKKLELNDNNLPSATILDGCNFDFCHIIIIFPLPYSLVGDENFPLKFDLKRLYPGFSLIEMEAVHYCRHSRAQRVTKNTFGILCSS